MRLKSLDYFKRAPNLEQTLANVEMRCILMYGSYSKNIIEIGSKQNHWTT